MTESAGVNPQQRKVLLTDLLKSVSRTFYLTLRILPKDLREPVGLAYLLARAADTIADTRALPREGRVRCLLALRQQVQTGGHHSAIETLDGFLSGAGSSDAEVRLLKSLPQALGLLSELPPLDAQRVRSIVVTLTKGMEYDLTNFPHESSGRIQALETSEDLDLYTYMVAGCVGEFWTEITMDHTSALSRWDRKEMMSAGVRFGKALQLTNILRDVPRDLRIGRCYLPREKLDAAGISAEQMMSVDTADIARPVLVEGINAAIAHFRAAEAYLLAIPRRCVRLRLAAAWPLLTGLGTLGALAKNTQWLDVDSPSKVSRGWIYRMMALSLVVVSSNAVIGAWIRRLRKGVERALPE